ncbi:MAG: hypothetical protein RIQ94_3262 [Pseudomonadota bacterium]
MIYYINLSGCLFLLDHYSIDGELYSQLSQALSTGQRAVREIADSGGESGVFEGASGATQTSEGSGSGTGRNTGGEYNQGTSTNRGSFNPTNLTISLLKNADLSTFLHETGHFFLEVQFDIAARMTQEVEALGATPGQQAILDDTQALLNWFGVDSLDTWFNFKPLFFVFCQNKWGSLIGSILQIAIYTK